MRVLIKKKIKYMCIILLVMIVVFFGGIMCSKYRLEITRYDLKLESIHSGSGLRIVQLSDLHNMYFGRENEKIASKVDAEKPDLIFITGDIVNSHKWNDNDYATGLIRQLCKIAPVYVSLGNQEMDLIEEKTIDIIGDYERAGATVLNFSFSDVDINGQKYRIGGIYGYCLPVAYAYETHREDETKFLLEFQDTSACKILLCHMPVSWLNSWSLYDWDVDVVFSGHTYGGQVKIPIVGGLWAPDLGWFPGKLEGVYSTNFNDWNNSRKELLQYVKYMKYDTTYYEEHDEYYPSYLALSRGLGNTDWMPRFNNPPEIVVVDLVPEEDGNAKDK